MKTINVGLIGFGTIGAGVYHNLVEHAGLISRRLGAPLRISAIADCDIRRKKVRFAPSVRVFTDALRVVEDPGVDIVVELIGGEKAARHIITQALRHGKHVVTANKALLAVHGKEIFRLAHDAGRCVYFEGSVGGGIPIIKSLREGLGANKIDSIFGIVNGTSNYVLTRMTEDGVDFADALCEAQEKGYAEKDPTLDIEGMDSAHKLVILSMLASGSWVDLKDVHVEGITEITQKDIAFAREFGYVVKLLAIYKDDGHEIEARVHPTLLPKGSLLSSIGGVYNAIWVTGDPVGTTMFYGRGAGRNPTSSAVISDLMDIGRILLSASRDRMAPSIYLGKPRKMKKIGDVESRAYLRVNAEDRPGVLAKVAGILGEHHISISSVIQNETARKGQSVPVALVTYKARGKDLLDALKKIDRLPVIKSKTTMIRIEEKA